jgi:hypothetical protein
MVVEPKEVIEKATIKKAVIVKQARRTRNKNEWCDKECEQLKKEAVNAFRKRKGAKEQRRKGVADRNKTVYYLFFWNCYFMFKGKYNQESESP